MTAATSGRRRSNRAAPAPDDAAGTGAPRPASTTRRGLVESEIFEHATRLFAERGFAGTTLQDVADAMRVTRPALYYYVKSKDDLLAKLVKEITYAPAADLQAIAARTDLDPAEKLRAAARTLTLRIAGQPELFRLVVKSEAELPPDIAEDHKNGRRAVLAAVTSIVQEGLTAGQFRTPAPRVAALGILGMCNWTAWWYRPDDTTHLREIADQLAEQAVSGLLRPDHRQPSLKGAAGVIALLREDLDHLQGLLDD